MEICFDEAYKHPVCRNRSYVGLQLLRYSELEIECVSFKSSSGRQSFLVCRRLRTSRSLAMHHRALKTSPPLNLSLLLHSSGFEKEISTSSSYSPLNVTLWVVTGFHIRVNSASRGATMGKVWQDWTLV